MFPITPGAATDESSQIDVVYYGRIRPVDTSGNSGGWTPTSGLKESSPTQLIDSLHIRSLTASKITAGTINAHEIILKQQGPQTVIDAPANMAILRSSDYNGSYDDSTSSWTNGTAGWIIAGDGHAEFSSASVRGTVKAGSIYINANNRWKTSPTGDEISVPQFKVGDDVNYAFYDGLGTFEVKGTVTATAGRIAGWDIVGNDLNAGNFAGNMALGPSIGPDSRDPDRVSKTGALLINSPISAGIEYRGYYNGYFARLEHYRNAPDPASLRRLDITPYGIYYGFSENYRFEFRYDVPTGNVYIVINGTEYQLCIGNCGGVTPPGGGGGDTPPPPTPPPPPPPPQVILCGIAYCDIGAGCVCLNPSFSACACP